MLRPKPLLPSHFNIFHFYVIRERRRIIALIRYRYFSLYSKDSIMAERDLMVKFYLFLAKCYPGCYEYQDFQAIPTHVCGHKTMEACDWRHRGNWVVFAKEHPEFNLQQP